VNVLFQDSMRYLQQPFTVLTFLAREEAITLLTCEHVRARMPELIALKRKRPAEHLRIWEQAYLPIARFVAVPETRCAGHPQIEAIPDPEDRPFARLAIATAPSLLLTRDHHLTDVGLGTSAWADILTVLGSLIELDAAIHGSGHAAVIAARLVGLLTARIWKLIESEPLLVLAALGAGLLFVLCNWEQTVRSLRTAVDMLGAGGTRLLEASEPAFQSRERALGKLAAELQPPMLPRDIESICARELAVHRQSLTTEALRERCTGHDHPLAQRQLTSILNAHTSFTTSRRGEWELGELGRPLIEG